MGEHGIARELDIRSQYPNLIVSATVKKHAIQFYVEDDIVFQHQVGPTEVLVREDGLQFAAVRVVYLSEIAGDVEVVVGSKLKRMRTTISAKDAELAALAPLSPGNQELLLATSVLIIVDLHLLKERFRLLDAIVRII